jgi:hypothetical protein
MTVVNDGHRDSGGSYADAVFESGWRGAARGRATVGPLAEWDGRDPVAKTARVMDEASSTDSTASPGAPRAVQSPPGPSGGNPNQDAASAKGEPQVPSKKPGGGPDTGAKSPTSGSPGTAPTSKSVDDKSQPQSYLRKKEPPPVPRDMMPGSALPADYQKVAEQLPIDSPASDDDVDEALFYAGVPMQLVPGRLLRAAAEMALSKTAGADSEYLVRGDVHPLKLVAMLDDFFGGEWRDWEPETIRSSLAKEAGVEPDDMVMDKVMAVKIALRRPDVFFERWQAFEKIAVSLNDRTPAMTVTEELDPEEMANAVTVVRKLAGDGDFSHEVEAYVAARLAQSGFVVAPPQLAFADAKLAGLVKDDGLRKKVILAYAQAVKNDVDLPESEDPVDIQVARLLRSHVYVLDRLSQGREQMGT